MKFSLLFAKSPKFKSAVNKIFLVVIFYLVAAASFNGFFVKWAFCDTEKRYSFEMMFDETAYRPFVHRQLMLDVARGISSLISDKPKDKFIDHLSRHNILERIYGLSKIDSRYIIEYHVVYFESFMCLLISMFLWRKIFTELTKNKTVGTFAACCFAIIFPVLETVGGYFYDFGELLFFTLAVFFALRGNWLALIIISPFAEYNKESFLFFVLTIFPLLAVKLGNKKAAAAVILSAFISGCVYLYVSNFYAGNAGGSTKFHLYHIKLAAAINVPLYLLFCNPNELRNLSMLYIGFIAIISLYIKKFVLESKE